MFLFEWTKFLTLKDMDVKTSYVKKSGQFMDDNKMINFSKNIILGGRNIIINKFVQIWFLNRIFNTVHLPIYKPITFGNVLDIVKATFCPKIEYLPKC